MHDSEVNSVFPRETTESFYPFKRSAGRLDAYAFLASKIRRKDSRVLISVNGDPFPVNRKIKCNSHVMDQFRTDSKSLGFFCS